MQTHMISQRTKAWILIALGAVGLILALWFVVIPLWRENRPSAQPPPVETTAPTTGSPSAPTIAIPAQPAADPNSPEEKERQAQERLKQQASAFVAFIGTYANEDGFGSLREAGLRSTGDLQSFLLKQRDALSAVHPRFGPSWGQTTRAVAARVLSGIPVLLSDKAEVVVQTQRETGPAGGERKTTYEEVTISFQKSDGAWIASRIEHKPYEP